MAALTTLASSIGDVATWFFTNVFGAFFSTIQNLDLILWPIIFAIVAGVVGMALRVIRKFGIKGRR